MSIRETMALKTILKIVGTWEKMSKKLESAIDVLKESISANNTKAREEQERFEAEMKAKKERLRLRKKELDKKNTELMGKVQEAEAFKKNIEKMFKQE